MSGCITITVLLLLLWTATALSQCERRIDGPQNFKVQALQIEGIESLPSPEAAALRKAVAQLCFSNAHELGERVRDLFQQRGYFKASISDPKLVVKDDAPWPAPADVLIAVDPGAMYRLRDIMFSGNKSITNRDAIRALFPIRDGEVLDIAKLRDGIKKLKLVYAELGFINFTPIPDFTFDEDRRLVNVKIDVDEGKQFFVAQVALHSSAKAMNKLVGAWSLRVGDIYNARLVEAFFSRNRGLLPAGAAPERNIRFSQDTERATVTLDVDLCASDRDCVTAYVPCKPEFICTSDSAGTPKFER